MTLNAHWVTVSHQNSSPVGTKPGPLRTAARSFKAALVLGKKSDEPCNADERGISIEGGGDGETEG